MNICIVAGKIVNQIEFKFIVNSKNKSIVCFDLELSNKSIVKVKAYDEIADYSYWKLQQNDRVIIEGKLMDDGSVEIKEIYEIN